MVKTTESMTRPAVLGRAEPQFTASEATNQPKNPSPPESGEPPTSESFSPSAASPDLEKPAEAETISVTQMLNYLCELYQSPDYEIQRKAKNACGLPLGVLLHCSYIGFIPRSIADQIQEAYAIVTAPDKNSSR